MLGGGRAETDGHPADRDVRVEQSQEVQAVAGADDVGDRVPRADLVEVDVLDPAAVGERLGLGERLEDLDAALDDRAGQPRGGEDGGDVGEMPFGGAAVGGEYPAVGGTQARAAHRLAHEAPQVRCERAQRGGDLVRVGAEVDHRPEQHVAGRTGLGVDVQHGAGHRDRPVDRLLPTQIARAMRAAATPAPKPLSTFTTVSPGAQVASIVWNAVSPAIVQP